MATTDIVVGYVVPKRWTVYFEGKKITTQHLPSGRTSGARVVHLDIAEPEYAAYWLINTTLIEPPHPLKIEKYYHLTQRDYRDIINELQDKLENYLLQCSMKMYFILPAEISVTIPLGADPNDDNNDRLSIYLQEEYKTKPLNESIKFEYSDVD